MYGINPLQFYLIPTVINNRQLADVTRDKEKCPFSALTGVCIKQVDFIDSLKNNFLSYTAFITKYNIKKNYLEYYEVVFAIEKKKVSPIKAFGS